jgi:hypothetical protein
MTLGQRAHVGARDPPSRLVAFSPRYGVPPLAGLLIEPGRPGGVKGRDWGLFVRGWPREDLDNLLLLLRNADGALKEVAGACRAARAALAGLRRRAEQRRGQSPSE